MSGTAIAWLQDFVGTRKVIALSSGPCCWAFSMRPVRCNMSGFVRASAPRSARNSQNSSGRTVNMRLPVTLGRRGRTMETRPTNPSDVGRALKAAGVRARTYRGSQCDPNLWWKSLTTTCKEAASVILRSFADGEPTRSPATAHMRSSKWFHRRNSKRFSRTAVKPAPATYLLFLLSPRLFLTPLPPYTRWIVIGVGSFLQRPQCFRNMTKIDPNTGPGRRSASHGVDQHVVRGEESGYLGMFRFPSLQTRKGGSFVGRVRNKNKRHLHSWRLLSR